jgi:hypothetical protein
VLTIPESKNAPGEYPIPREVYWKHKNLNLLTVIRYLLTWAKKNGAANQLWIITAEGEIENVQTNLVLDVAADGSKVS